MRININVHIKRPHNTRILEKSVNTHHISSRVHSHDPNTQLDARAGLIGGHLFDPARDYVKKISTNYSQVFYLSWY